MGDDNTVDADLLATENYLGGNVPPVQYLRLHVDRTGGQTRPQQEEMLTAVADAIAEARPLIVQAGTGTGKSLAYAFAAAASGKRAVITTATNQLGEQLATKDLPEVADILSQAGKHITVALLKGRNNYVCKAKLRDITALGEQDTSDGLFDMDDVDSDAAQFRELFTWAENTDSGDRSEGPAVTNTLWRQVSVSSAECAGSNCPFISECYTEQARRKAKDATVVLTNHSLVAQEIRRTIEAANAATDTPSVFGEAPVFIIDEAHSFAENVTSAFSVTVDPKAALNALPKMHSLLDDSDEKGKSYSLTQLIDAYSDVDTALTATPSGTLPEMPSSLHQALNAAAHHSIQVARELQREQLAASSPRRALTVTAALGQVTDYAAATVEALNEAPGTVRWVADGTDKKTLNVAPIEVGDLISKWADLTRRTIIATSATVTVGTSFEPMKQALGMVGSRSLDVGTPFTYQQQGVLYVPAPPFPAPIGKDRVEHTEKVMDEIVRLVGAAGGRALVLFTTTAGALRGADTLRHAYPALNVLCHGEAPADALVKQFRDDEHSVLCATMGMWHGVDVPGPSCSLVIVDKVPFAPMDDAVSAARRTAADNQGRNGFMDVFVADAVIDLAQAAGRLVRRADDKGVVAILDPRLHTKSYGRVVFASLPPFVRMTDGDAVAAALTRLTGGMPPHLNTPPKKKRAAAPKRKTPSPGRKPATTGKRRPAARRSRKTASD